MKVKVRKHYRKGKLVRKHTRKIKRLPRFAQWLKIGEFKEPDKDIKRFENTATGAIAEFQTLFSSGPERHVRKSFRIVAKPKRGGKEVVVDEFKAGGDVLKGGELAKARFEGLLKNPRRFHKIDFGKVIIPGLISGKIFKSNKPVKVSKKNDQSGFSDLMDIPKVEGKPIFKIQGKKHTNKSFTNVERNNDLPENKKMTVDQAEFLKRFAPKFRGFKYEKFS